MILERDMNWLIFKEECCFTLIQKQRELFPATDVYGQIPEQGELSAFADARISTAFSQPLTDQGSVIVSEHTMIKTPELNKVQKSSLGVDYDGK